MGCYPAHTAAVCCTGSYPSFGQQRFSRLWFALISATSSGETGVVGFRFRRSVKVLPGVRLNISSKGISTTVGVRGASINIRPRGTTLNVGIPGTGISYSERLSAGSAGTQNHVADASAGPGSPPTRDDVSLSSETRNDLWA